MSDEFSTTTTTDASGTFLSAEMSPAASTSDCTFHSVRSTMDNSHTLVDTDLQDAARRRRLMASDEEETLADSIVDSMHR